MNLTPASPPATGRVLLGALPLPEGYKNPIRKIELRLPLALV
jgi:hypothetical protein